MLIEFTVENFRSYKDAKTLSLVASPVKELPDNCIYSTILGGSLLRAAVVYGANASGKSNLLAAMGCMSELIGNPMTRDPTASEFPLVPFALNKTSPTKSTRFKVKFLGGETLYEYTLAMRPGFVEEEVLKAYPMGRSQEWFNRKGTASNFGNHLKGMKVGLQELAGVGIPLLAVAAAFDHAQLTLPAHWLEKNLGNRVESWHRPARFPRQSSRWLEGTARLCSKNQDFNSWVSGFLRHADLGIQDVKVQVTEEKGKKRVRRPAPDGSNRIVHVLQDYTEEHHEPYFVHTGEDGFAGRFDPSDESHGTMQLFAVLAPLYEVLQEGQLAVIDEFGTSMHPNLIREVIRLFQDPNVNRNNAQLVFATHDTSLLSGKLFRRDQVWLAEKTTEGVTDLYSLQDIKDVREDEAIERGYLRGRYGAIPYFSNFDFPTNPQEGGQAGTSQEDPAGVEDGLAPS